MSTDTLSAPTEQPEAQRVPRWLRVSRSRAFTSHLGVSAVVVGSVCALIFFVWYPHPYFQAVGAWSVVRVLVGVDLVLGPVLTLILFKPGKRGLKFDLAFIACVQLAALVYGVTVLYRERPYFNVFAVDRFALLAYSEVDRDEWTAALAARRVDPKPWRGPVLVVATRPADTAGSQRLLEDVLAGKRDIDQRPEYWSRYETQVAQVVARQRPLTALSAARPESASAIAALATRLARPQERLGFLPIRTKRSDVSLVIDAATGEPLEVIAVDPWIG